MIWHPNLYAGASVADRRDEIIRSGPDREKALWLILLPVTDRNQLQIMKASDLSRWYPDSSALTVAGLAGSRREAEELTLKMTEDALARFGEACPRNLFRADLRGEGPA